MTENKGDLISREALKKAIYEWRYHGYYDKLIEVIDNAPTVEQKYYERVIAQINPVIEARPPGEWIEHTERITLDTYYECSNCKEPWTTIEGTPWQNMMNFCPNCGAKMRGGAE